MTERVETLATELFGAEAAARLLRRLDDLAGRLTAPADRKARSAFRDGALQARRREEFPFTESDLVALAELHWLRGSRRERSDRLFQFLDDELEGLASVYHVFGSAHRLTETEEPAPTEAAGLTDAAGPTDAATPIRADASRGEAFGFGMDVVLAAGTPPEGNSLTCTLAESGSLAAAAEHLLALQSRGLRIVRLVAEDGVGRQHPEALVKLAELVGRLLQESAPDLLTVFALPNVDAAPAGMLVEDDALFETLQRCIEEEDSGAIQSWLNRHQAQPPFCVFRYRDRLLAELIDPALPAVQRSRRVSLVLSLLLALPCVPAVSMELITAQESEASPAYPELVDRLHTPAELSHLVFEAFKGLAVSRASSPALHPLSPTEFLNLNRSCVVLLRRDPEGNALLCVHNLTSEVAEVTLPARRYALPPKSTFADLVTGDMFYPSWEGAEQFSIELEPEEVMWLTSRAERSS